MLYLTKKDQEIFQRLVNKLSPYPTIVVFEDNYKISSYAKVSNNEAMLKMNTFLSAFYNVDDREDGREMFHQAFLLFELSKLMYSDFNTIEEIDLYEDKLVRKLQSVHDDYWKAFDSNQDIEHYKDTFKNAYVEHYLYSHVIKIFDFLESGAVENQLFLNHPMFSDSILYTRKKLVEYDTLELIYTEEKGLPVLLQDLKHFSTYLYKSKKAGFQLEFDANCNILKELVLKARLDTKTSKERLDISNEIINYIKEDIIELGSFLFEDRYLHRFRDVELMIGNDLDSLPGRSDDVDDAMNQFQSKPKTVDLNELEQSNDPQDENKEENDEEITFKRENENLKDEVILDVSDKRLNNQLPKYTIERMEELLVEAKQNAFLVQKRIVNKKRSQFKKRLDYGSRLDSRQLFRAKIDGKVYQISKKSKKTDVVVSILIDSSFSMQGKRQKQAIETAYKLGIMLQDLRIPFCVNGHSVNDEDVTDFVSYVSFDQCKSKENLEEIFHLDTYGFTHEYMALKEALEQLCKYKRITQRGLVIVISDAETESRDRIKEICSRYKRLDNTEVLCIAVGKLGEVANTYENYLYLPTTTHFFQSLVKEFERLSI